MKSIKIYGNNDNEGDFSHLPKEDFPKGISNPTEFLIEVDTEGLKEIINKSPQAIRKITRIG